MQLYHKPQQRVFQRRRPSPLLLLLLHTLLQMLLLQMLQDSQGEAMAKRSGRQRLRLPTASCRA
jgi:hypothetical protein